MHALFRHSGASLEAYYYIMPHNIHKTNKTKKEKVSYRSIPYPVTVSESAE